MIEILTWDHRKQIVELSDVTRHTAHVSSRGYRVSCGESLAGRHCSNNLRDPSAGSVDNATEHGTVVHHTCHCMGGASCRCGRLFRGKHKQTPFWDGMKDQLRNRKGKQDTALAL